MDGIEDKLDNPPAMKVVYDTLPKDAPHGWKYLAFGPDGKLYFNIGAPCNICIPPDTHANISRVNVDGTRLRVLGARRAQQRGLRLAPGDEGAVLHHARARLAGRGRAERSLRPRAEEGPALRLSLLPSGRHPRSRVRQGPLLREFAAPLIKTGPHVAGNGVEFYTGSMFPPEYKNRAFLAQRGSWNRTQKIGFRVMMVTLRPGDVPKYEPFAEGWLARRRRSGAGPSTPSR